MPNNGAIDRVLALVDFTRIKSPPERKRLIHGWIQDPGACLCEPVAFEVLRHATLAERPRIEAQFSTLPLLSTPPTLWRDATRLGQACRDQGITAGSLDLLIAALAIYHGAELITFDADYTAIGRASSLRITCLKRE